MIEKIKTGVIGVGSMGQNHARIYNEISNLVGVADPDPEQGSKVAERFGVIWYSDYREMLEHVDAVSIAVPTAMHIQVAKLVAASGVHLLVEKPLASNAVDGESIVRAAERAGVILAVGHVERHNPVISHAKTCIDSGVWGDILTISVKRFSNYPARVRDVGVLFDLTIHDVDVIRYLLNDNVKNVFVSGGKSKNKKFEDHVNLMMTFEEGSLGLCETNWLTPMKVREMNITTTDCFISLNYLNQEVEVLSSEFGEINEANLYQPPMKIKEHKVSLKGIEPLKSELVDFLEAIIEKRMPLVTGWDGLKAVEIVQAGLESMRSSSVINI